MRLIDENEYQEKLAKVPMELRTYRKAVEVAEDMPTVKAIPLDKVEQILSDIDIVKCGDWIATQTVRDMLHKAIKEVEQ